ILPLRGLDLPTRPLSQRRALAWSSDAELAVAADDSVLIYVPEFPILDPARPGLMSEDSDDGDPDDDDEGGSSVKLNAAAGAAGALDGDDEQLPRCQFSEVWRHLPISHPPLHPDLNRHVWEAAGREMPVIHHGPAGVGGDAHANGHNGGAAWGKAQEQPARNEEGERREEKGEGTVVARHPGAGVGIIGASGASMNHVVAVGWSPAGIGRNGRPVLAVLTGVGSLAVYGEGGPAPFGSTARPLRNLGAGRGAARDLQSWVVLWAVGENFVVPGQEEYGYGEFVKAFAWCREVGGGRALLAYLNDVRELVVLSVGTTFRKRETDGLEEAIWNVQEVMRLEAAGPHGHLDIYDPDFVPSDSSYCLRWSPWVKDRQNWSCLLSYMDRHYVGFKRISVDISTWEPQEAPEISYDPEDWEGRCVHLGPDAFLEFEDMIWHVNNQKLCRGIIATPWPMAFGTEKGEDNDINDDDDDDDDDEDEDEDAAFDPWAREGPDVHPFRVRIWGIAMSPGGGTTAVLSSSQLAVRPEKGTWRAHRSRVVFESQGCRATVAAPLAVKKKATPPPDAMEVDHEEDSGQQQLDMAVAAAAAISVANVEGLSTEARVWEWMYGGGDGVPGLTPRTATDGKDNDNEDTAMRTPRKIAQERRDAEAAARRQHILDIFAPHVARQTCTICADGMTNNDATTAKEWPLDCFCENGHRVAVCGASGLAITEPQTSRCCGVCQSRCLNVDFLVDRVLVPAAAAE
ncbi:hypothetical protein M406DRAFT_226835, partial [Cryphonectria parasitica EP155]